MNITTYNNTTSLPEEESGIILHGPEDAYKLKGQKNTSVILVPWGFTAHGKFKESLENTINLLLTIDITTLYIVDLEKFLEDRSDATKTLRNLINKHNPELLL